MSKKNLRTSGPVLAFDSRNLLEAVDRAASWKDGQVVTLRTEIVRGSSREVVDLKATMNTDKFGQRELKLEY